MNSQMQPVPLKELCDEDVAHFVFKGRGRLILDTIHGEVIIDIRLDDVNAFTLHQGRADHLLIAPRETI